jgi:hypothetical protein
LAGSEQEWAKKKDDLVSSGRWGEVLY